MKIRHKLREIRNPRDLLLLLRIAALASLLPFLQRWMTFPTLLRVLKPWKLVAPPERQQIDKIVHFANFVLGKGFSGKRTCLKESLLLYHFLKRAGVDVEMNIGIRKAKGLMGHSWLTYQGSSYLDHEESAKDFQVIYSSEEIE